MALPSLKCGDSPTTSDANGTVKGTPMFLRQENWPDGSFVGKMGALLARNRIPLYFERDAGIISDTRIACSYSRISFRSDLHSTLSQAIVTSCIVWMAITPSAV